MNLLNLIVLEYSPSQRAFHRHSLADHIKKNIESLSGRQSTDWHIIDVYENYDAANADFLNKKAGIERLCPEVDLSDSTIEDFIKN